MRELGGVTSLLLSPIGFHESMPHVPPQESKPVWHRVVKIVLWLVGSLVALCGCLGGIGYLVLLYLFPVGEEVFATVSSPAVQAEAVLSERNGGATTGFAYVVRVRPLGSRSDGGTVFLADKVSGGPEYIKMNWEGSTLIINYPIASRVFQQEYTVNVRGTELAVKYRLN